MRTQILSKTAVAAMFGLFLLTMACRKNETLVDGSQNPNDPTGIKLNNKLGAVPASETLKTVGNGTFYIVNRKSGKMLDVAGQSTANGANVTIYGGTGGGNQKWTFTQLTGGYYSLIGVQSGKGLQIDQSSVANGGDLNINSYTGALNQQWQFISIGSGYYRIVNRNSGKDLDVSNESIADNAEVVQWTYGGGEHQQWALIGTNMLGSLGWQFTSTANMTPAIQARITAAMNDACARYNASAPWPARTVNVEYNTGVATADANAGSNNIRFGPSESYQNTRTAMHELGHIWGVGQTAGWYSNTSSGPFTGAIATAVVRTFDGPTAVVNAGGGHFWPYGLNYDNEWSESGAFRHVKLVYAMRADGM